MLSQTYAHVQILASGLPTRLEPECVGACRQRQLPTHFGHQMQSMTVSKRLSVDLRCRKEGTYGAIPPSYPRSCTNPLSRENIYVTQLLLVQVGEIGITKMA